MVIESVTNSSSKTIHVVNLSTSNTVKVGRGSQCEVRITDVSVSRHHASFEII
jgi:pSer/pThr/pTyr-binding forkhead associated (FHA) protein